MHTARKNVFFYQKVALFFNEKAYICKNNKTTQNVYNWHCRRYRFGKDHRC